MRVMVPIHLMRRSRWRKTTGRHHRFELLREVEIECLPADIPEQIDADVSNLEFGMVLRVKDLPHGGKLKFITDEEQAVAHVTAVKEEVAATPGCSSSGCGSGRGLEPAVIKKGKQDAEAGAKLKKLLRPRSRASEADC